MAKTSQTTQSYYAAYGIPMPQNAQPSAQVPLPSAGHIGGAQGRNWGALALRIAALALALGTLAYVTWYGATLMRNPRPAYRYADTPAALNMTVQQPDPLAVGGWRVVTLRAGGGYAVTDYPSEDDARRAWVLARITDDYAQLCAPSAACAPSGAVGASHGWTYQPAERKP